METLIDVRVTSQKLKHLLNDLAADADWLRTSLARHEIEFVCPHLRGRKKKPLQGGRALRRYRHRWIIERTFAWLFNFRKLIVRH